MKKCTTSDTSVFLSKNSKLVLNRSITFLEICLGSIEKFCFRQRRRCRAFAEKNRQSRNTLKRFLEEEEEEEEQCNQNQNHELVKVIKEEEVKQLDHHNDDGRGLRQRYGSSSGTGTARRKVRGVGKRVTFKDEEDVNERNKSKDIRMKVCNEVMERLKEIEVMESSDINQLVDLNEVVLCYSLITDGFFVDLVNQFIKDVTDGICKPNF